MLEGWIKLHRQITENEFYFSERFTKIMAWIDLLLLANHKAQTVIIRGNEIKLNRGETGYAIKTLAKRWKWNDRTVDKYLQALSKRQMIQCRKSNITTIISINNYDLYQGCTDQNTEQNTVQSTSRIHTDKNVNNVENVNNDKNSKGEKTKFIKPSPQEVAAYALSIGYNLEGGKFCDFYDSKGWMIGKNKMKDWKAAVRTWKQKDYGGNNGDQSKRNGTGRELYQSELYRRGGESSEGKFEIIR